MSEQNGSSVRARRVPATNNDQSSTSSNSLIAPIGRSNGVGPSKVDWRSASPATTKFQTVQQIAEQTWHKLFWLPLVLLAPASIYSFMLLGATVRERQQHMLSTPDKYNWTYPELIDLKTTAISLFTLVSLRVILCQFVFRPLGDWMLPTVAEKKGSWTEASREDRIQRFSACVFKLFFFLTITIYGWFTLRDEVWLPPQLFGHGDESRSWDGWPFTPISDSVKTYYLIELSYHVHSLCFHIFSAARNDFIEMTLHHTCAVLLVVFSYYLNWVRIGTLVLFLHDIADVTAYAVKAFVDTKYTKITLTAYAALLMAWGYTRLYVFPFYVIPASLLPDPESTPASRFVWYTSESMLWILQCLHIYWYVLFLVMGYRFLLSGKTVDIQQKAGEMDGSYVDYHKRKDGDRDERDETVTDDDAHHGNDNDNEAEVQAPSPISATAPTDPDAAEFSPPAVKPRPVRTRSSKSRRAE